MSFKSKNRKAALATLGQIGKEELLAPLAATKLLAQMPKHKFDQSFEVHFRLGIDTRQADQQLRGSISLPHGTGQTVRVAVFAEGDAAKEAKEAGAVAVGSDDLIKKIQEGWLEFDAAVATPDLMPKVAALGKVLGPRNLMPNPKLGTVTTHITKIVSELQGGRVEYRADKFGIVHVVAGKASFTPEQLAENYGALYSEILRVKPSSAKGKYVKSISVCFTMSPGIKIDPAVTRDFLQ